MEEANILESAEGIQPAEDISTPAQTEQTPAPSLTPEEIQDRKTRNAAAYFLSPSLMEDEQEEIPEAEIVPDPPVEEANPPQPAVEAVALPVEEAPAAEVEAVPATAPQSVVPANQEGWPTIAPKEGFDIWGNILVDGVPMLRYRDEETGKIVLEPADPETGLAVMSQEELDGLKLEDPDLYIQWMTEKNERKLRLGQVLTEARKTEVAQTHEKLKQNGMPEKVISAIHTRAEQILQPLGGLVAPGIYQQAILGATAEMLAYGGDRLVDLARAIIANHEGQLRSSQQVGLTPKVGDPPPAPAPVMKPATPIRLATGGLGASGAAAPAVKPAATKEYPPVDAATMAELTRLGMTVQEWYES